MRLPKSARSRHDRGVVNYVGYIVEQTGPDRSLCQPLKWKGAAEILGSSWGSRTAGNPGLGKCCGSGLENVAHDEDLSLSLKSPPSLGYGEFCPVELPRLHPWIFEVIDLAQK